MIPLYGFLQGDTIGVLIFAYEQDTAEQLARKLEVAASTRVAPREGLRLHVSGKAVDPKLTVAKLGLRPLERVDGVYV